MQVNVKPDGSEQVLYNDPRFPFYVRTGLLSKYDSYSAVCHWHDDLELISILRGHMWYHVGGEEVLLEEGQGIFVNSRQLHYGFSRDRQECHFVCILLHPSLLAANDYMEKTFVSPMLTSCPWLKLAQGQLWQEKILEQINEAAALECKDASAIEMHISALKLFSLLSKNLPQKNKLSQPQGQTLASLKEMIRYVQEHYGEKISLTQIAGAGNVSRTQCGNLFRRHTGVTPGEYLTQYRLQKARTLLTGTDLSIIQIALETGFGGSSYFCEVFRKNYQITPMQFRNICRSHP